MPQMRNRTRKVVSISALAVLVMLAVILYVLELLTSEPVFNLTGFSLNYVISLPFMLLSIIVSCGIAVIMNRTALRKLNIAVRTAVEGLSAGIVAGILVIVGNLPFVPDMAEYVRSVSFLRSTAAAALINIFILAFAEYFIQAAVNRRLRNEITALQYRQLKSQINPHFLFNSLNALVGLINKDSAVAVKCTKQLSAVYRYVLTQDQRNTVTVREEMDFIGNYTGILRTRFSEGLDFRLDIRPSDLGREIPPMSLQLLIENAVKRNSVSPGRPLTIVIATDGNSLSVSNNINPRLSRSEGTGVGLSNLSKKYDILTGRGISVFHDADTFSVKLPLL